MGLCPPFEIRSDIMKKIFIAEDDTTIRHELEALLRNAGYLTECLTDFEHASQVLKNSAADLFLLDINLPYINGEQLLKDLRSFSGKPVIMVTSRQNELDEVISMSYGADDYITKPYNPTILLLRISAVLKRSEGTPQEKTFMGLSVNPASGSISGNGKEVILTKNEMMIFRLLLDNEGRIVTRDEIMTVLWDNDEFINDNALTVNISRLRAKLSSLGVGDCIETRKKQGYILVSGAGT